MQSVILFIFVQLVPIFDSIKYGHILIYTHVPPFVTLQKPLIHNYYLFCLRYATRKTMRNVLNTRFLACFRPVVDIDAMLKSRAVVDRSANRSFACIHVADKHDTKNNSATISTFLDQELAHKWVVPAFLLRCMIKLSCGV